MCIIVAKCERGTAHSFAHAVAAAKLQCVWLLAVICLTIRKTYHYSEHTKSKLDTHTRTILYRFESKKMRPIQSVFIHWAINLGVMCTTVRGEREWVNECDDDQPTIRKFKDGINSQFAYLCKSGNGIGKAWHKRHTYNTDSIQWDPADAHYCSNEGEQIDWCQILCTHFFFFICLFILLWRTDFSDTFVIL